MIDNENNGWNKQYPVILDAALKDVNQAKDLCDEYIERGFITHNELINGLNSIILFGHDSLSRTFKESALLLLEKLQGTHSTSFYRDILHAAKRNIRWAEDLCVDHINNGDISKEELIEWLLSTSDKQDALSHVYGDVALSLARNLEDDYERIEFERNKARIIEAEKAAREAERAAYEAEKAAYEAEEAARVEMISKKLFYYPPNDYDRTQIKPIESIQLEDNHLFPDSKLKYGEINYFFNYYPRRITQDNEYSNRIIRFKRKDSDSIKYFSGIMQKNVIRKMNSYKKRYVICCAPSHVMSTTNDNSCARLIDSICANPENIPYAQNGKNIILRYKEIPSAREDNSVRSIPKQYSTIKISDPSFIANKTILLIDDIYTTGSTIIACGIALIKSGAGSVIYLTMGRTTDKWEN